jgi:pseudouridine-5'-phosphate glycosidase
MLSDVTTKMESDWLINRAAAPSVALETTLLAHGVPTGEGGPLASRLAEAVRAEGANPLVIGILRGRAIAGLAEEELGELLSSESAKINSSNLGVALHSRAPGATTVSTTMEIAAAAGVDVLATGGVGGVHREPESGFDVSSDLVAFTRFPVAVVASGVKSILDVKATRETFETLGVPVVGYQTDDFPAFYRRTSAAHGVDARFDDVDSLAEFLRIELHRSGRGILVCNPIPAEDEITGEQWRGWIESAEKRSRGAGGRGATPAILDALHDISEGATLRANIALVMNNARLASRLAVRMDTLA